MKRIACYGLVCAALAFAGACSNDTSTERQNAAEQIGQAADASGDYAAAAATQGKEELRQQINRLKDETAELRAKADNAGNKISADTKDAIAKMEQETNELGRKLDQLGDATEQQWNEFQAQAKDQINDIQRRYNDLKADLT